MSGLFRNHIVGFYTRWLISVLNSSKQTERIMEALELYREEKEKQQQHYLECKQTGKQVLYELWANLKKLLVCCLPTQNFLCRSVGRSFFFIFIFPFKTLGRSVSHF